MNEILQKRNQVELNLGLENLLIQFKNNDFDLLRGYFEQHSSLEALFYLLQQEQQQQQQTLELVLKVLVNILRNTKQLGYKSLGTLICRRITREFLPLCYRELNSGKPSFIAPTLELLAGIAIYTTSTCRELAKCFNFNLKSLCSLFKVRKQNIRQLNARFLLSFLVKGDFHVRQNFLGVKNLLQKLFLELHTDNVEFVDYVLGVLEKRVVVEAELKLSRLLHIGVLENLLLLYKQVSITINEGPVVDDVLAQEITRKMMLSDRVDRFFRTLCTVQGQGLLAEKESNSTMLKFMLALKVTNDFKQRQLLLDVMRLQPDLIHQYFAKTTLSFEPRSTVNYLSNIALVTTIIAFPCKFDPSSTIPAAKAVINGIIPPAITKQIVSKGISSGVVDVYFAASVQLQTSFKKLHQVLGEIESAIKEIECDPHLHANTCQQMVNGWQTLTKNILSEFKQKLPDSQVIIKHLKSNLVEIDDNNVTSEDVFVIMTQLLQNYAVFAPEQFQDHSYDFSKAIPVHVDCMGDDAIKSLLELLKVVKEFKWWTKHSNYRTCFGVLFDLYLARSDQHLKILIEDNLSLFFEDTFMFQGYKEAIKLLWKVACRFSHNGNVGRVLEEVLFAGYHESKKLFEETVNLYKSGIEEVENPVNIGLFPPVFLVLLRRAFKSEDVTVHLLCSSYIMETVQAFCIWEGLPYILKVLDKYLDVSEAEKNGCLMGLSNWMKSVSGLPIVFPTLEMIRWNQASKNLKETTAFAVELFKMNGSVFESRFSDLYRINIDQRHVVFLYLQLLMNVDDLEPEIFGSVPNVTLSPILYVLFKARKTTPLYRNALTHARKFLGEKFNSEAIEIYLGNILFWARFCAKFDLQRLEIALELAISTLSGIKPYSPSNKLIYNVQTVLDSFDFLEFDGNMNVKSLFFHLLAVTNIADAKIFSSRIVRDFLAAKSKGTTVTVNMTLLLEYIPHSLSPQDLHAVVNKGLSLDVCEGLLGPVLQFLRENPTRNLVVDKMNSEYFLRIVCVHKGVESKILHEMLQTAQIKSTVDLAASVSDSFISDVMMEGSLLGTMVCCQLARWSAHRLEELCAWINCNILEANERTIQLLREVSSVAISNGTWIDHIPKFLKVCVKKMSKLIVNKVFDLILNKNGLENNHLEELLSIVEIMQVTIPAKVAKKAKFLCVNSCHEVGFEVIVNILQISLDSKTNRFAFESAIEVISSPVSYNRFQEGEALCKLQKFVQNCPEIVNDIDSRIFSKVTDIISERSDFKCPLTLALLKSLIQNRQAVDCVRILNLCTSNSTYAEIITGTIIENSQCPVPVFSPGKTTLLQIFALLMTKDPKNCCQLRILKDLIRNYHGSLAEADVETLKIMKLFEKESKDSLLQYLGSWGDEQERENFRLSGASLSKIDPVWMANSLHWFDFSSDITRVATGSKNRLYARGISPAYDPAFFVLFTVAILDCPDLDPQLFIESKLMGLCILTLSSESLDTRILGHHVVSKAYNFIQNSDFKDRNSVTLFLDFFRNGIDPKGKRFLQIPSIITQFVAKGLMNLSKRESHFYPIFNRFCLQRNSLDVEDVPMFYELFYSQNDANRNERNWLLKLLLHGMNSRNDYKIFKRRHTIDILLGYYNINEGDSLSKKLILLILYKGARDPSIAVTLIKATGLLSFLKQQAATASMNTSLDITLALSRLILQLHTTFSIAPVEWIGANDGQVWSNQFLIVVKILLDKFLNLSTKPSNWKTSFVEPILILLQNLSKSRWGTGHTKLLSHIQVQNLLKCRAALVALDIEYSLSNNDIDHLFKEGLYSDSLSSIHAALIQVILCSPSADRDRIETFRWCFENVHKEQLDSSLILECVKEHIHIFTIDQNVALTVLNFLDSLIRTTVDVKLRALALYCFFQMKKCQPVKKRKRDYHSIDQKLEEYQQLSLQIYEEQASPSYKLLEFLTFLNNHF